MRRGGGPSGPASRRGPRAGHPPGGPVVRPGERARLVATACVLLVVLMLGGTGTPVAVADPRGPVPDGSGAWVSAWLGVRERPPATTQDRRRTALWGWPLAGTPRIVQGFDPPQERWGRGHRGLDLAGVAGERVLAVDDGVVTFSGEVAGVGVVSITHVSGLRSTYQPVEDRVPRGSRVAREQPLGRLAAGGHCPVHDCLHLGAVRGRDGYVDPTPLLLGVELSLLPVR